MWIGEIIETGENKYNDWLKKIQSMNYLFKQEMTNLCDDNEFNSLFECKTIICAPITIVLKLFLIIQDGKTDRTDVIMIGDRSGGISV